MKIVVFNWLAFITDPTVAQPPAHTASVADTPITATSAVASTVIANVPVTTLHTNSTTTSTTAQAASTATTGRWY